jgi:hypothetical protein
MGSWGDNAVQNEFDYAKKLEEYGHTVHFLSPRPSDDVAENLSGEFISLADSTQSRLPTLKQLEREYKIPSIPHLYFTEMNYFALSRSQAIDRTRRFAQLLTRMFETTNIDYVYQGRGGEIHRLLAHYFVQENGGANIWGEFSPFDNRVAFSSRLNGTWDSYETVPDEDISSAKRKTVDEYIESFRSQQKVYTHGNETGTTSRSIKDAVAGAVSSIKTVVTGTTPNNIRRYSARKVRTAVNEKINRRTVPTVAESKEMCENNTFLFFPLQYPIESRLTVFSPEFFDQAHIIDYISRILPEGVKLFVKQHPNHPGQQSPAWTRQREQNTQVEFLHPSFNAHKTIEHAEGVVVTNNTVGFEALFHTTPLVVLGRAFYEDVPAARHVSELSELPGELSQAVNNSVEERAVRSSIHSLREATYPVAPVEKKDERISTIADALFSFIDEYA